MLSKNDSKKLKQIQMVSLEQLVPQDHLLRKIDAAIDFSFIYDLVEEKYSLDNGRPSIDPVMLIKIPIIQYMFGINSMRQTIKEIEVNVAYRWFLGLDFYDSVPHFSTFGKNYKRRFSGTDLFEQIFMRILFQCMQEGLVDTSTMFVDSTHVKACANRKKAKNMVVAKKNARFYDEALMAEINADRSLHGKKPFKKEGDSNTPEPATNSENEMEKKTDSIKGDGKTMKVSTTDPESGWFHKGEHKEVFAYSVETGCDKHGWILGYTIHPGNEHDSTTFPKLYEKLRKLNPEMIVADAGYKIPAIAKLLIEDNVTPIFPYKRPMTKEGYFKKYEYLYDESQDLYLCPNKQGLTYSTTNREGYREYKSDAAICASCPYLSKCTNSKGHLKVITRHIWESYIEECEKIRLTPGMKEIYQMRKETIERSFGTAKEYHGMRYTHQVGMEKMGMKVAFTFTCMNMKKLVRMLTRRNEEDPLKEALLQILYTFKTNLTMYGKRFEVA